jgi:hypothetical protein
MDTKTAHIRALNDQLRQNFAEGLAVMTPGVAALGAEAVARIVKTIPVFDDFCHANDPHQEHDFGGLAAPSILPNLIFGTHSHPQDFIALTVGYGSSYAGAWLRACEGCYRSVSTGCYK